jgi:carboxylesterase
VIVKGGEPFLLPGGPFGCLLLHDLINTPHEVRGLGFQLNEAGFSVLGVRLFGHATHHSDLKRTSHLDWIASMEDGFSILDHQCDKVAVIGFSMGGALALIAGARLHADGVVAISTPFSLPTYTSLNWPPSLLPILRFLSPIFRNKLKPTYADQLAYPVFPSRVIPEIADLLSQMHRLLPHISVPTLLIHSDIDPGVPPYSGDRILERLGTKKVKILKIHRGEDATILETERERMTTAIITFVANLSGSRL